MVVVNRLSHLAIGYGDYGDCNYGGVLSLKINIGIRGGGVRKKNI